MKNPSIPLTMRALVLDEFGKTPLVKTVEVPRPSKGQILVKIDSSPINPSDYSFMRGLYSTAKKTPVIPGFEASGTVVAAGGGFMAKLLLGKRVACFAPSDGNGTWAEYMVTKSGLAVPLMKGMELEQGAMLMVNPISVMAMIDLARKGHHKAIANTAGASALGRFLNIVCNDVNLPIVNIVRREDQAVILKELGAKHILVSESPNFVEELTKTFSKLQVTLAFDAVGGQSTFDLISALPPHGEVKIYGALSEEPMTAHPGKLIFEHKKISGFWVSAWVGKQPLT
ncbi:MAG: zinc-binding dehydrogenase [Cyclobacteriaceae bacterium]|nr:zinc-binding dehydrogenase [Cyclobacteriaceae bacterium]